MLFGVVRDLVRVKVVRDLVPLENYLPGLRSTGWSPYLTVLALGAEE
jgi:hypothetical protein